MTAAPLLFALLIPGFQDRSVPPDGPTGAALVAEAEAALEAALDAPLAEPLEVRPGDSLRQALDGLFAGTPVVWRPDRLPLELEGITLDDVTLESVPTIPAGRFPLRAALDLLLASFTAVPLTALNDGGVLLVTTELHAEERLETRTYPVRDLLAGAAGWAAGRPVATANGLGRGGGAGGCGMSGGGMGGGGAFSLPATATAQFGETATAQLMGDAAPGDRPEPTPMDLVRTAEQSLIDLIISSTGGPDDGGDWEDDGGFGSIEAFNGTLTVRQTQRVHRQIAALLADLRAHDAATAWDVDGETAGGPWGQRIYHLADPIPDSIEVEAGAEDGFEIE